MQTITHSFSTPSPITPRSTTSKNPRNYRAKKATRSDYSLGPQGDRSEKGRPSPKRVRVYSVISLYRAVVGAFGGRIGYQGSCAVYHANNYTRPRIALFTSIGLFLSLPYKSRFG